VLGRVVGIARSRDHTETLADGTLARVTIHPSALLRLRTKEAKRVEYQRFVGDLQAVGALIGLGTGNPGSRPPQRV
jgi:hypothetical protein